MKKLFYKISYKLIDIHNRKVEKEIDNYKFLQGLCISNNTLDLNKNVQDLWKWLKKDINSIDKQKQKCYNIYRNGRSDIYG